MPRKRPTTVNLQGSYGNSTTTAIELGNLWRVRAEVVEKGSRLVIRRIVVEPLGEMPEAGLTARDLRTIRTGDLLGDVERTQRIFRARGESLFPPEETRRLETSRRGLALGDDQHARVALDYLAAMIEAPQRPIASMVERYRREGHRRATAARIRDRVHLARKYGWLTPGLRGFPGGQATDKLIDWEKRQRRRRRRQERKGK